MLSFKVLGPLSVESDGVAVPVPVSGQRQRTVLAVLLLCAGRPVSVDSLIEAVWQGAPPATARNQIAICITTLRRIFRDAAGDDRLISTGHRSYVLDPGDHVIDVQLLDKLIGQAGELVRQGRSTAAARTFGRALALWNGTALEGLSGGLIDDAAFRLSELWLDVNEEYAAVQLQLGDYRSVVSRMSVVVEEHPLREQARFHLMLALRRSGRRADALETYRAGRRVFTEELGTEPGPALQELHQQILQDLAVNEDAGQRYEAPAPPVIGVPAQLPAPSAAFTGRESETAQLDRLLDVAVSEAPLPIAALSGTSGVGKTALAVHWANRVSGRFPDGQLFVDMRGFDDNEPPVTPIQALDRCLRALGVSSSHKQPALTSGPTSFTAP